MARNYEAIQIGGLAKEVIKTGVQGSVIGVVSKGIFINSGDKIIFLTSAAYKSPYNIQVRLIEQIADNLNTGDICHLVGDSISFPQSQLTIDLKRAEVWFPDAPKKITCSREQQIERVNLLCQKMNGIDSNKGWLFLRDIGSLEIGGLNSENNRIRDAVQSFVENSNASNLPGCLLTASSIIGLGGGLTPSGDDWLTGFMLIQSRVDQSTGIKRSFVDSLGKSLIEMATQKTTKISANRISAACSGWAEEIFLDLVEHILVQDSTFSESQIRLIMEFGHSSGVDTSMGVFAACPTQKPD
jgi:hypothetical protein